MRNDKNVNEFTPQAIAHRIKDRMPQGLQTGMGVTYLAEAVAHELAAAASSRLLLLKEIETLSEQVKGLEARLAKEQNGGRDPEDLGD